MDNAKKRLPLFFVLMIALISGCQSRADKILALDKQVVMNTEENHEVLQFQIGACLLAWHDQGITGKNVRIAILGTGVDMSNTDLAIAAGVNFTSENVQDYHDDDGHGTKIAGIIGAKRNDYNLRGIAYDAELYIAKVVANQDIVSFENVIKGIEWAIEKDVHMIHISPEWEENNESVHRLIQKAADKGILIIASSGDLTQDQPFKAYPAQYKEVVSIGMLDMYGRAYDPQFFEKKVDLFAPGQDIASLYFDEKMALNTGASFAAAYATGYLTLEYQNQIENGSPVDQNTLVESAKKTLEKYMRTKKRFQ